MSRPLRRAVTLAAVALAAIVVAAACSTPEPTFPVATAPTSRHDALRDALTTDAHAFSFANGDWLEDRNDAPFYGLAWLAHRDAVAPLGGDDAVRLEQSLTRARTLLVADLGANDALEEQVMAAFGVIERIAATGDLGDVALLDTFLDRLDTMVSALGDYVDAASATNVTVQTFGPTAVTALVAILHAQYALFIDGPRTRSHQDRAIAIEQRITDVALTDLVDGPTSRSVRGYAIGPDSASLEIYPNAAMLVLEARLYRLTRNDIYLLEARAIYAALQPLKLSDAPARYASPYAAPLLKATTANVATLSSQNALAFGLLLLFEITGDVTYSDEADRMFDAIESTRGPWCLAQVDTTGCTPSCASGNACLAASCTADRCTTGLLYDEVDGRLALPTDPVLFCSGCNLQTLYVLGYRRLLAGEPF